jgi:hypothetical protein
VDYARSARFLAVFQKGKGGGKGGDKGGGKRRQGLRALLKELFAS